MSPAARPAIPIPRSAGAGTLPLAGSRFAAFSEVQRDGSPAPASSLTPAERLQLTALRPPLLGLSLDRPRIMAILNLTPDSFSDGGDHATVAGALAAARRLAQDADVLDIGGESTRPGADPVPEAEEIARVVPVIRAIRETGLTIPISIDTRKAAVAAAALDAGADMINDVSALGFDPGLAPLAAERQVPVVLMHARGDPRTMQDDPRYDDVLAEVFAFLEGRIEAAEAAGIARDRLVIDPGIGFGKKVQHNVTLLSRLALYHSLGPALLVGASRKRFIGTLTGTVQPKDRLAGSLAVALQAAAQGAQILRVHDARETRQALALWQALSGQERQ